MTPCILWPGLLSKHGYGRVWDGEHWMAHRAVYVQTVGPIPKGYHVHHRCGVKACVNPHHLVAVSPTEHRRRFHCGTHCERGHDKADAYVHPATGLRQCRPCRNAAKRASWARHKDRYNAARRSRRNDA